MRVYGLTQIEEYKWDEWQATWRREHEMGARKTLPAVDVSDDWVAASVETVQKTALRDDTNSSAMQEPALGADATSESENTSTSSISQPIVGAYTTHSIPSVASPVSSATTSPSITVDIEAIIDSIMQYASDETADLPDIRTSSGASAPDTPSSMSGSSTSSSDSPVASTTMHSVDSPSMLPYSNDAKSASIIALPATTLSPQDTDTPLNPNDTPSSRNATMKATSTTSPSSARSTVVTVSTQPRPSPSTSHGGHTPGSESIYRNIMNRLTVLESNSSLGVRYMEEQTRYLREMLKRLEQDVGRLENLVCLSPFR